MYKDRKQVTIEDIDTVLRLAGVHAGPDIKDSGKEKSLTLDVPRGAIRTRGKHQAWYIRAMEKNPIVFSTGPLYFSFTTFPSEALYVAILL